MAALDGIRVLELSTMITGPLGGQMLADLGAEVIKVENPAGGDMFRAWRGGTYSAHFLAYNRNKRSITLNLRSAKGRDILLRLVESADVLIENFRPGVMDRLDLSLATLRERNPRLIYCSITGFGEDGPYRDRPAYDAVAQSLSGVSSMFLDPESPQITGPTIADNMTGINACYGILGALIERERTGIARRVDVNMLESAITFMPDPWSNMLRGRFAQGPLARVKASQSYALRCADGKLLAVHLSSQPKFWEAFCGVLERTELIGDARFKTRDLRIRNYRELCRVLNDVVQTRPRSEWMTRLEAADVPFAPVQTIPEVIDDRQVQHLHTFYATQHPTEGKGLDVHRPVLIDGTRQEIAPAPTFGEHTEAILREFGYGEAEVQRLRAASVI